MLRLLLEINGWRVLTAQSGEEGLDRLSQEDVTAIVLDNRMPGMSGLEVAARPDTLHVWCSSPAPTTWARRSAGWAFLTTFASPSTRRASSASSTTTTNAAPRTPRLGFRLLVFGGLALMWVLQGRLGGGTWEEVVRAEVAGLMPWAFLAPIVLAGNRRIRIERLGLGRFLAAHLLGMVVVFIPYWGIVRGISLVWACVTTGWEMSRLIKLAPTKTNVLAAFLNVPFVYFVILLGAEAMRHAQARRDEEVQAERLAAQLSDARLALLQRQLHPHFLFNALQAISTLLHRDPESQLTAWKVGPFITRLPEFVTFRQQLPLPTPIHREAGADRRRLDINRTIRVNGVPLTVVGVLGPGD